MKKNYVYILEAGWEYEGTEIVDVFAKEEDARKAEAELQEKIDNRDEYYDFCDITEKELK